MRTILKVGPLVLVALACACAGPGSGRAPAPVEDRALNPPARSTGIPATAEAPAGEFESLPEPETSTAPATEPAVVALLDDSDRKLQAGQQEAAAAAVERALRISPSNALLWYRLAAIRVGQGQWSQAEALAQKSLSLSGNDVQLQSDNWKLIARARRELGDAAGARAAENAASRAAASAVQ